jgi:hypothetical protein
VNGVPVRQNCSPGLHYSQEKEICDWPDVAKCDASLLRSVSRGRKFLFSD